MTTYRKTKTGEWVAFGPAAEIKVGAFITVTKKDGSTKQETVSHVGKEFIVDGVSHIYGYLVPTRQERVVRVGSGSARKSGCGCDDDCCAGGRCRCDSSCNCRGGNIYDC